MKREILIKDYWYELPEERIAKYPLPERDSSKLLVYKDGAIAHSGFKNIGEFLPVNGTLFFNNTKVIPARLFFQKETGAVIELFLLNPVKPSSLVVQAMEARGNCQWECIIGNLKRWTEGLVLRRAINNIIITASLVNRDKGVVEFTWEPAALSFAEVIVESGQTPLPPYLNREAEESDKERYQTVYSQQQGAVAAPTAGLHFTDAILDKLRAEGHHTEFLTLHVSAGTFQPVKVENAVEHTMHNEQVVITKENIEALLKSKNVVAVGTTSMRTLESLFWFGVRLSKDASAPFRIEQDDPYTLNADLDLHEALTFILNRMEQSKQEVLYGETSIYIMPGYDFKVVDALVTNFHQPGSTLMLLVAAFIGEDWKKVYDTALTGGYRFLSYGDSSLLFKAPK